MIAKIIARGRNPRAGARSHARGLGRTRVRGVKTNLGLLRALLTDPLWCEVPVSTTWLERQVDRLLPAATFELADAVAAAAALLSKAKKRTRRPMPHSRAFA